MVIGFNQAASHRIVDMRECHVLVPELFALVAPLRAFLLTLLADRRGADVQMTLADQGVDLLLGKVAADGLDAAEALTAFAHGHRLARLAIDDGYGAQPRWEPDLVTVTLGGVAVPLPSAGFLQATAHGETALVAAIAAAVGDANAIADLFAGLGTFALPLSAGARVLAVEGARDAALALKARRTRRSGRCWSSIATCSAAHSTRRSWGGSTRWCSIRRAAGAKEQVAAAGDLRGAADRLCVVCNPAGTFARDAATLVAGGATGSTGSARSASSAGRRMSSWSRRSPR